MTKEEWLLHNQKMRSAEQAARRRGIIISGLIFIFIDGGFTFYRNVQTARRAEAEHFVRQHCERISMPPSDNYYPFFGGSYTAKYAIACDVFDMTELQREVAFEVLK